MFIYFRLILCFLNPFIRLERYHNYNYLGANDQIEVTRLRRTQKLYSIAIIKSTRDLGIKGHKEWYFRPRFK